MTNRIPLVFDLGIRLHLGVVGSDKVVEILCIVDGGDGLPQAPRLVCMPGALGLKGAHYEAVAQEKLLVEGGWC